MVAARYPALVGKLILVGCPPFEEQDAASITKTRLDRLSPENRGGGAERCLQQLEKTDADGKEGDKNALLTRLGSLLARADSYDPQTPEDKSFYCQYDVFQGVWDEACELRHKKIAPAYGPDDHLPGNCNSRGL